MNPARSNPAKALNGVRPSPICDRCNKRVRTGDLVRGYATYYDPDRLALRRLWCDECGESAIGERIDGVDEIIIEVVFCDHRLVLIKQRYKTLSWISSKVRDVTRVSHIFVELHPTMLTSNTLRHTVYKPRDCRDTGAEYASDHP